jgi:hypothetical protein
MAGGTLPHTIELGVDTFGDVTVDDGGRSLPHAQALRDVVAEGIPADQVGLDFFGVGEHHCTDFAVSAPEVVLAAIASRLCVARYNALEGSHS